MSENQKVNESSIYERIMGELYDFLDVPIKITIQLGQCSMKVGDILRLQPNSIIELPKSAGENVDILMNQKPVAFGEVLELEGSAGIRLTDLHNQT